MLGKFMLGKPTKSWDLYLDQALFACRVRTHTTNKASPFYLLYGRHPHLLGDPNKALPIEATAEGLEKQLKLVQSARTEAARKTYEKALKHKAVYDAEIVKSHDLDVGQWVLVRHENPQKFESKWFGPYQIIEKMLLGTYRLQDPNARELAALVHGNRLIAAEISSIDKLEGLWASPRMKDILRRRNVRTELVPSHPENTDALDQHLLDSEDMDDPPPLEEPPLAAKSKKQNRNAQIPLQISVKRPLERPVFDEIVVQRPPKWSRQNATPSST